LAVTLPGSLLSLRMISLTWRPRIPPWLLTSLCHSWYPRWKAWPSEEKAPVSDSEAPMTIGDSLCAPPPLPQLASTDAATTVAAAKDKNRNG